MAGGTSLDGKVVAVTGAGRGIGRAVALADGAAEVSGRIFAMRMNELFPMSRSRPLRSVHGAEGWTPEAPAGRAVPALRPSFCPLDRSADVVSRDSV